MWWGSVLLTRETEWLQKGVQWGRKGQKDTFWSGFSEFWRKVLFWPITTARQKQMSFNATKTKCEGLNFAFIDVFNIHSEKVGVGVFQ